jgi:lambda family phage tail tape measure protein
MNNIEAEEANTRAQNTFQAGWNKAYNNFTERAQDSAALGAEAFSSMANSMTSAIDKFVQTGKFSFSDFTGSIIRDLISIQLKAQATGIFSSLFGGMFGGGDGMGFGLTSSSTNIANGGGLMGLLGFADGGSPPVNQPSIVGERGAELFVPRTAGTIIPNNSLSSMMGGQAQTVYNGTVIQNMNAIDTQSGVQFISKNKNAIFAANQSAQRGLPQSR